MIGNLCSIHLNKYQTTLRFSAIALLLSKRRDVKRGTLILVAEKMFQNVSLSLIVI